MSNGDNIFEAVVGNNTSMIKEFISHGGDVNTANKYGDSLLRYALSNGSVEAVELLLEAGANPNLANDLGNAPLHWTSNCDPRIVQLFLEAGADPNLPNNGVFPIYSAVKGQNSKNVKLFLDFGADLTLTDKYKRSAISIAKIYNREETVNLIECWPRVVPLRTLCLRIIRVKTNSIIVPLWLPPILLEFPTTEEMIPQPNRKRALKLNQERQMLRNNGLESFFFALFA